MNQLPIGTQAFEKLRRDNAVYVDKTEHIDKLINSGSVYFLSRPRRFGKSLLISTLKELFKGNKEIFEGLYIYDKWDWSKKYPVIHLDFTEIAYKTSSMLESSLLDFINSTALNNSIELTNSQIQTRFSELIEKMHINAGERVVILIDEYDKPTIDSLNKSKEVHQEIKETLHNFYQVLKGSDEHERFVFLTGVSQFSGLSVFSALNNLNDITMDEKYASICGYTQEEVESNFNEHIEETAKEMEISKEELLSKIKYWYNGYSWDGKTLVYNPISMLKLFDSKEFKGYWYETGTPTFLIEEIKKKNDLEMFIEPQKVIDSTLRGSNSEEIETVALFFQTGYLTIKKKEYVERKMWYILDFPNYEVESAFLSSLLKVYTFKKEEEVNEINKKIGKALKEIDENKLEESLKELLANIPYDLHIKQEKYYHSLFLIISKLSGYEPEGEEHTDKGRIDVVLRKEEKVIVVEIKYVKEKSSDIESKIKEAIGQIRDRKYYEKYARKEVSLLAIAFGENKEIRCKFESV